MKLAFDLPLPDFLIPGSPYAPQANAFCLICSAFLEVHYVYRYAHYGRSIKELDSIVKSIIDQRRENGIEESAVDLLAFMMRSQQKVDPILPSCQPGSDSTQKKEFNLPRLNGAAFG